MNYRSRCKPLYAPMALFFRVPRLMKEIDHTLTHLVLHRLDKRSGGQASLTTASSPCAPDGPALLLMEALVEQFARRSGKGFGRFGDAHAPLAGLVDALVRLEEIDFLAFSLQLAELWRVIADEEELDEGGVILAARACEAGGQRRGDCLWLALLGEQPGVAANGDLGLLTCMPLDVAGVRALARIDLDGWRRGDERYLAFLRARGALGACLMRLLGCGEVVVALQETRKLVRALDDFAQQQAVEPAARDALRERAHAVLDELAEVGLAVDFDELAREVCPEDAPRLAALLQSSEAGIATGFVPNRRALRPLVRFSASGSSWKLEFDRSSLQEGSVHYDPDGDRLVLSGLPESLREMLREEATREEANPGAR